MPPRLYHASSSPAIASMVARLALVESGEPFVSVPLDIHRKKEHQAPDYVRKNPNMTVPTLELDGTFLTDSRDILFHALAPKGHAADDSTRAWVDRHYSFPIGAHLRLARRVEPARAPRPFPGSSRRRLRRSLSRRVSDLAELYRARAEVFAGRVEPSSAKAVAALFAEREQATLGHLDALEAALADGRATLVPPGYGPADVVWTVFLAALLHSPARRDRSSARAQAPYESMFARPSTKLADLWLSIRPIKLVKQMLWPRSPVRLADADARPSVPGRSCRNGRAAVAIVAAVECTRRR